MKREAGEDVPERAIEVQWLRLELGALGPWRGRGSGRRAGGADGGASAAIAQLLTQIHLVEEGRRWGPRTCWR
ncbi:MAG TPA: hypothetical protein VGO93_25440, partial [Candidatus Xenobia bacterium]